jgi:hypothetical protein
VLCCMYVWGMARVEMRLPPRADLTFVPFILLCRILPRSSISATMTGATTISKRFLAEFCICAHRGVGGFYLAGVAEAVLLEQSGGRLAPAGASGYSLLQEQSGGRLAAARVAEAVLLE